MGSALRVPDFQPSLRRCEETPLVADRPQRCKTSTADCRRGYSAVRPPACGLYLPRGSGWRRSAQLPLGASDTVPCCSRPTVDRPTSVGRKRSLGASDTVPFWSRLTVDRPTSVGRKRSLGAPMEVGGTMYIMRPGSVASSANRLPLRQGVSKLFCQFLHTFSGT